MSSATRNRETWLTRAVSELRKHFRSKGYAIPTKVRVTCGWTSKGQTPKINGQCWYPDSSEDATTEIFISPMLDTVLNVSDGAGYGIIGTLVHELVHAAVGPGHGHSGEFITACKALGLVGTPYKKSKASFRAAKPGEALVDDLLRPIIKKLGKYPHAALDPNKGSTAQRNRHLKVECKPCEYRLRGSRGMLENGLPGCGVCGNTMELAD